MSQEEQFRALWIASQDDTLAPSMMGVSCSTIFRRSEGGSGIATLVQ
jgi:hypothetical protein